MVLGTKTNLPAEGAGVACVLGDFHLMEIGLEQRGETE